MAESGPPMNVVEPVPIQYPAPPGALPLDSPGQYPSRKPGSNQDYYGPEPAPLPSQVSQPPPPLQQSGMVNTLPPQSTQMENSFAPPPLDIRAIKDNCQANLIELMVMQGKANTLGSSADLTAIRSQGAIVLGDLKTLNSELIDRIKLAESHRWRRWLVGGGFAFFIPLVRKIFRRKKDDDESEDSVNNTEYAFKKSKSLLGRIKNGLFGGGGLASIAFFVFAVLYVFQNEVTLRVARTLQKRLKKLTERIEYGDGIVSERDLKSLDGWRWTIVLW